MLGAIAGDIIGSIYEFDNTRDYDFPLFDESSVFTDDSLMTLAVASWLLEDRAHSLDGLEKSLCSFAEAYPHPAGGYGVSFRKWLFFPENLKGGEDGRRHPYGSWGNGSAMRASACGWFFDTIEQTERVAGISASITHNHPEGIKGAQVDAAAIFLARTGKSKSQIRNYIESRFEYDLRDTWENLHRTYRWDDSCQGTVPQAVICFLESSDFEDAVRKAVSIGGDSDTLACITGGIAEAFYGGVPSEIRDSVIARLPEDLRCVIRRFSEGCPGYILPGICRRQ